MLNTKNVIAVVFLVCLALFFTTSVSAKGGGKGECRAEVQEVCKGVEKGEGRIRACIEENKGKFSSKCQTKFEKRKKKKAAKQKHRAEFKVACGGEVEKFCAGVEGGNRGVRMCMGEHSAELSTECLKWRDEAKSRRAGRKQKRAKKIAELKEACASDVEKFCSEEAKSGKRRKIMTCMKKNQEELSPTCSAKVKEIRKQRGKKSRR